VLVILTLSGGGTRAAALAYGTMEALRDVKLRIGGRSRRLLDEVDVINAVSAAASSPPTTRSIGKDSSAISSPDS
jgi:NTE family protein